MEKTKIKQINTTALAYIGDAVYELYVREYVMNRGCLRTDKLHKDGIKYVNANSQALAIKKLFENLTEEEKGLVKRARNRKTITKAKNTDIISYKWATAFEALIGYLYLLDNKKRMEDIIDKSLEVINEQG